MDAPRDGAIRTATCSIRASAFGLAQDLREQQIAGEGDDDLIEVPFVAAAGGSPTDAVGEFAAEFQAPLAVS
jgi:hypothetical protein